MSKFMWLMIFSDLFDHSGDVEYFLIFILNINSLQYLEITWNKVESKSVHTKKLGYFHWSVLLDRIFIGILRQTLGFL